MRSRTALGAFVLLSMASMACGARTDLPGATDEIDGSLLEDAHPQDVTVEDVAIQDASADTKADVEDASIQDAGADVDDGAPPPPACTSQCTHNYQCELTCPSLPSGRWCCDEQVGICYAFAGKHCPSPIVDAGFD